MSTIQRDYKIQEGKLHMTLDLPDKVAASLDKKKLRNILGDIARNSHNFYLSTGKELNKRLS